MQKRIAFWGRWILGMVLIAGAVVAVTYKDQQARVKYQRECQEHMASIAVPVGKYTSGGDECKDPKDYMPWWDILVAWPEGITTWAIILTLGAISWQAFEARKSTDVARDAVNAAYVSVTFAEAQWKLMIEEKRARLDLSLQHTGLDVEVAGEDLIHLIATFSVRNIGASKAFIGRTSGTLITRLRNEALGDYDDYSSLDLSERVIVPDQLPVPIKVYCFPTTTARTFAECLEEGTFTLHFFGFIEYETLGFWRRKEFGYEWKIIDRNSGLGGLYGLSDPYPNSPRPAKDRITYGYWSYCSTRRKFVVDFDPSR